VADRAPPRRREEEREEAYARNPDQPMPVRTTPSQPDATPALMHGRQSHSTSKARPVPALLMKRKAPQTESA